MLRNFLISLSFIVVSFNINAANCYESVIEKPVPFMGNDGEIFKLSDGSLWEVKYEYEYMYEYSPAVTICPDKGKLIINNKKLTVEKVN